MCQKIQRYRKVYSEKSPPVPALECPFPNSEAASATQFLGNHRESPGLYKQMYRGYIFQSLRPVLALVSYTSKLGAALAQRPHPFPGAYAAVPITRNFPTLPARRVRAMVTDDSRNGE